MRGSRVCGIIERYAALAKYRGGMRDGPWIITEKTNVTIALIRSARGESGVVMEVFPLKLFSSRVSTIHGSSVKNIPRKVCLIDHGTVSSIEALSFSCSSK